MQSEQNPRSSRYSDLLYDGTDDAPHDTGNRGQPANKEAGLKEIPIAHNAHAQRLQWALRNGVLDHAWRTFEKAYTSKDCKALTEPVPEDVELLKDGSIFEGTLKAFNAAFCRGDTSLPVTPSALLFRYEQLGIARPRYWTQLTLLSLTRQVIQAVNGLAEGPRLALPGLLRELLSVWRLFFQCMGSKADPLESINTDWNLPTIDTLPDSYEQKDFNMRMQDYHPKFVGSPMLGFCAAYLYSISDALDESLQQQAAPFLKFLERLLAGSRVDSLFYHTTGSKYFLNLPPETQSQIIGEIDDAPRKALVAIGGAPSGSLDKEGTGDSATNLAASYFNRIGRAVLTKTSPTLLDTLWREVVRTYTTESKTVEIPRLIYNAFLPGYMVLGNSQRSVEVWNHMIANCTKPDIQSYNAMLEGCAKAKDLDGFNAMWARLQNSGIEPDNYSWTTRVNGLMTLRQTNPGLIALDDMGKRWLSAEAAINPPKAHGKGQKGAKKLPAGKAVNNCTKPSVEVINGAISGIVQIKPSSTGPMRHEKRVELVQKILTWSSNFQIKPDAITYNSLIQLYLQAGNTATAFRILSQMAKAGLEGDIATHTMLLTTAFNNQIFDGQTPEQQTERILGIFDDLEASGMKMNDYVYATAIDRLLKQYANIPAVRAIMEHMTSRRFIPSAHVYTSLATHYFAQQPPNIREVDAIVNNLLANNSRVPSDQRLYDRLIEGYAEHAEVGKMMTLLTQMSKQGKLPGWQALIAVVRALVQEGDYERARDIVRDVNNGEGVAKGGVIGMKSGEHAFHAIVRGFGLGLDEERMGDFMREEPSSGVAGTMFREESGRGRYQQEQSYARYDQGPEGRQYEQQPATAQYEDALGSVLYKPEAGSVQGRYSQRPPAMEYSRDNDDAVHARAPGNTDDEEDVDGFLTDEPEVEQRRPRP
jgi:pentatricopeptide repeat protein